MKFKNAIKTISLSLICISVFTKTHAQDSTKVEQATEVISLNKIRLNLLGITYEREQKVGRLTSVYFAGGVEAPLVYEGYSNGSGYEDETYFNIFPTVNAGIRRYYNFEKRNKKGKKTVNNGANYYGLEISAYFAPLLDNDYFGNGEIGITPQWGFQRSIGKKINFELMLGPTLRLKEGGAYFGADGRIGFSFLF